MLVTRDQNANQNRDINCEQFIRKYVTVQVCVNDSTNPNVNQEEIERRLNCGNACYHSVKNILSSRLLSKNIRIITYKTIILPVVLHGCETWSLALR
jgi:hypothetical protein